MFKCQIQTGRQDRCQEGPIPRRPDRHPRPPFSSSLPLISVAVAASLPRADGGGGGAASLGASPFGAWPCWAAASGAAGSRLLRRSSWGSRLVVPWAAGARPAASFVGGVEEEGRRRGDGAAAAGVA